ncbi:MAG: TatD family hydrolase, partial [Planctomycetota bacterium]
MGVKVAQVLDYTAQECVNVERTREWWKVVSSGIPTIDSHAHLYFESFDDDRQEVIARAREAGVFRIVNIGI